MFKNGEKVCVCVSTTTRPAPASGPAAARLRDIFASQNHFSGDAAPGAGWAEVLHFMYTGVTPKWQSGLLGIWGMRDY